jgi:hypothetical protein
METLPEVIRLQDTRGQRPEDAVGVGTFWYDPEVWTLPISPAARVLYASLCSYLGHHEINRKDLRNTLKDSSDHEIAAAFEELISHRLFKLNDNTTVPGYEIRSVRSFESDSRSEV